MRTVVNLCLRIEVGYVEGFGASFYLVIGSKFYSWFVAALPPIFAKEAIMVVSIFKASLRIFFDACQFDQIDLLLS